MKKIIPILTLLISHPYIFSAGIAENETSIGGSENNKLNNVIFYGTLESRAGKKIEIESIFWNHSIRRIEVYEMPSEDMYAKVDATTYQLKNNPKEKSSKLEGGLLLKPELNLANISTVEVKDPSVAWVYLDDNKKDCCDRTQRPLVENPKSVIYTEIVVTDKTGKTDHYLAPRTLSFTVEEKRKNDEEQFDIPTIVELPSVRKLTIDGYRKKDDDQVKPKAKKKKKIVVTEEESDEAAEPVKKKKKVTETEETEVVTKKKKRTDDQAHNNRQLKKIRTAQTAAKKSKNTTKA